MIIDEQFLQSGMYDNKLNKSQYELLNQSYPPSNSWQSSILNKEISLNSANLFLLLKGKFTIEIQNQIIENYNFIVENKKQKNEAELKAIVSDQDKLIIYCDGACSGNPGKSGSGLAVYFNNDKPLLLYGQYVSHGTNNTAELNALNKALKIVNDSNVVDALIFCDSKYSIDCITKWAFNWKKASWTKKGGNIKNLELIKKTHNLYLDICKKVKIRHVKAHNLTQGNELADRMARISIIKQNMEYKEYSYNNISEVMREL